MRETPQDTPPSGKRARFAVLKVALFGVVLALLLSGVNVLFQPVWYEWNNYHTHHGFYQQPANSVEGVFVGASLTVNSLIPTQMYEEQGICTYNLATEWQPMMASYYWVKEAYRKHPESLKTVLLDVSQIRKSTSPAESLYHKALDNMELSPIKVEAAQELSEDVDELLTYLIPAFSYHDRWSKLDWSDFIKNQPVNSAFYRGYNVTYDQLLNATNPDAVATPLIEVTDTKAQAKLNADSLVYFERLVTFCREHNLQLVGFSTPTSGSWSDGEHNAIQSLTDRYGIAFLDFGVSPLLQEIDFNPNLDTIDGSHMGYSGAVKLSSWIARYLRDQCQLSDVRDNPSYAFMQEEVTDWHHKFDPLHAALDEKDPAAYIKGLSSSGNYTLFITTRDEASYSLTSPQRKTFWDMGLTGLATLGYHDCYAAIVDNGTVTDQKTKKDTDTRPPNDLTALVYPPYMAYDGISFDKDLASSPLVLEAVLRDGKGVTLTSGGAYTGNISSCVVNAAEHSPNSRGINVVVYDNDTHRVVNTACFDTHAAPERERADHTSPEELIAQGKPYSSLTEEQQSLYRYNMRALHTSRAQQVAQGTHVPYVAQFLQDYAGNANVRVLIAAKDEAAQVLSTEDCQALAEMGFGDLATLGYRESYCGVQNPDDTIIEQRTSVTEVAALKEQDYSLQSAGLEAGNYATIRIAASGLGTNHATNQRGLQIVVYDPESGDIIEKVVFEREMRTREEVVAATANRPVSTTTGQGLTSADGQLLTDANGQTLTGTTPQTTAAQTAAAAQVAEEDVL
ncbi:MAG: hypothetical protein Q4A01_04905 [Coriobacteriales bacterium]|nr:hypothetical protein [Coriobacteriales bacterium]